MTDTIKYRLALILPGTHKVFASRSEGIATLPIVEVAKNERHVEQLTMLVKQNWQISAVVLDILPCFVASTQCAVLEVVDHRCASMTIMLELLFFDEIHTRSLLHDELGMLKSIASDKCSDRNLFGRIGWLRTVQQWIIDSLPNEQLAFAADVLQLNCGGGFALARLCTTQGSAYWLKAVRPPNDHEFRITQALTQKLPKYLPRVVTTRPEWGAWVTEDSGSPLSDVYELSSIERVAMTLANFQIDSIQQIRLLEEAGCPKCRISVLESNLPDIISYLEEAMALQTSMKVAPLTTIRLRELEQILRRACCEMEDLGIPDTVIHNDINPGNVLLSASRCVFIDWAEGLIGNPFLTFQHICAQITRDAPDARAWLIVAKRRYRKPWLNKLSRTQIDRAYDLMPILALLSYLYGRGTLLSSIDRHEPHIQAHSRSLARLMDRVARTAKLGGVLCL